MTPKITLYDKDELGENFQVYNKAMSKSIFFFLAANEFMFTYCQFSLSSSKCMFSLVTLVDGLLQAFRMSLAFLAQALYPFSDLKSRVKSIRSLSCI